MRRNPRGNSVDPELAVMSPELDELRSCIYELERGLARFGLDPRRGIESYSVAELKSIVEGARDREELRSLLLAIVGLQERLYQTLYGLAGLREVNVDTDMPEKRLATIRRLLLSGNAGNASQRGGGSKMWGAITEIAERVARIEDDETCAREVVSVLKRVYKRDYDRCRVLRLILNMCVKYGALDAKAVDEVRTSLRGSLSLLMKCRKTLGNVRLGALIKLLGRKT